MTIQVHDFLLSPTYDGSIKTSLQGVFVISRGRAYMAASIEAKDDLGQAISLDYEQLKPLLMAKVPAYGGGAYLYCDPAIVEGVIVATSSGEEPRFVLRDVASFALTRRGQTFQVLP